jgi:hypothetical protein
LILYGTDSNYQYNTSPFSPNRQQLTFMKRATRKRTLAATLWIAMSSVTGSGPGRTAAFAPSGNNNGCHGPSRVALHTTELQAHSKPPHQQSPQTRYTPPSAMNIQFPEPDESLHVWDHVRNIGKVCTGFALAGLLSALVSFTSPVWAENELSAKYGGGLDTSLVDQNCLVSACSLQTKACLQHDPSCRKGLTCTAKCLGDNACITGCMARYGNANLDNLLKCTIEDHECIKVAILEGGADVFGQEPRAPAPTVTAFDPKSLQGSWFKVVGYNPNYDCYACQRNTFSAPDSSANGNRNNLLWSVASGNTNPAVTNQLRMDVEFSMPHLLPDGSPPPPSNVRESILVSGEDGSVFGSKSIALNDYRTRETMVFDQVSTGNNMVFHKGTTQEVSYSRTAHSEGEMFGLKFWENWYIIGENDPGQPEFKFVYYNGKTRQNTYEGAFVYSRSKELAPESMAKVYSIAKEAGMKVDQFCRIRNGCFSDETVVKAPSSGLGSQSNPFRGILASTRISQLLGVEPVAARDTVRRNAPTSPTLQPAVGTIASRPWWYEIGDYLENPHRHFQVMDSLRLPMTWAEDVKN